MLDMVVRFSLPDPKALHPMKTFWMDGKELRGSPLNHEEPFESWDWWEALGEPWGGIACVEEGQLRAVWFLAERRLGPFRLWRMPLSVPYAPILTPQPLSGPAYATRAPILRALANFLQKAEWHLRLIAGTLPPEWSYLPPLWQEGLRPRAVGSFVIHRFEPSSALRRKLRQAEALPVWPIPAEKALAFWHTYAPQGIHPKFRRQMEALVQGPFPWEILAVGEPPHAVGFFLWGQKRVWYLASAHRPHSHPQAGTKLLTTLIQKATQAGKTFDFMGSVIPSIERFFWQFRPLWEHRLFLITPLLRWLSS
jgi:hypothetical protein